jgi:outer membrane protein, multidrug efflux system
MSPNATSTSCLDCRPAARSRTVVALLCLLLGGCLIHSVDKEPKAAIELPKRFTQAGSKSKDPGNWWQQFGDAELNELFGRALEGNLMLAQAWARYDQGKALDKAATAGLFPRLDASISSGRSKSPPRIFNLGQGETTIPGVETNSFNGSLPMSYELDVWGRVRSGMFAAEKDVEAFRADVEAMAVTVAANVTERWLDVVEQRARRKLLNEQLKTSGSVLALAELQFKQGQAALSDVYQQRTQLQSLQTQLIATDTQESLAIQNLAVLLAKVPGTKLALSRTELPKLVPLPTSGVPSQLLLRRPDLRAARARVVAQDYRVGAAIAARFPQLSLSGSIGLNAQTLSNFFESFVWNFLGSIGGTVFDGGRLAAEVDRNRGALQERLAAYGQALLNALLEVESTLVQERQQRATLRVLNAQVETSSATVAAARLRFLSGVTGSYLPTLTAIRSLQLAEQNLLRAERQLLSQRVQLYRALGSTWTQKLKRPKPSVEQASKKKEKKKP